MQVQIDPSWEQKLNSEFKQPYFAELTRFVKEEYDAGSCYPPGNQIFEAFNSTPFEKVKVVILGQDPYHGIGQAHGLCFSVNPGIPQPPSLVNIFKEIQADLGIQPPADGNLLRWAQQGVLMLNATLTVRAHEAGSHQRKGWEIFTDAVIKHLSDERKDLVFLLWGGYAKKKGARIDTARHKVLATGHPSPLSANRGYWFGNKHFSKTNEYLKKIGKSPIVW